MTLHRWQALVAVVATVVAALSIVQLERSRSGIEVEHLQFSDTPVTLYRGEAETDLLVVVSHGFAGSRQMMEAISLTLARAGHVVVAFDYLGHGRHPLAMSSDIHSISGTTEDLVQQTLDVIETAQALTGLGRTALIGHSMSTDVIVRTAARRRDIQSVAAISMYSEAVTPEHPSRLLIVSGAQEVRLREVALQAVGQLGAAEEGFALTNNGVERRAIVAPWVGHVGVLWSDVTSTEITAWLGPPADPARTGPWIAGLIISVVALFWPLSSRLPGSSASAIPSLRRALFAALAPAPLAILSAISGTSLLGYAGFGALALFLGVWGAVVLCVVRPRLSLDRSGVWAAALLTAWGLLVFGLTLDRYGAAFLPHGPRLSVMAALLPATFIYALADRVMVHGRHAFLRILLRLPVLGALLASMLFSSDEIGMLFTALPVLTLFMLVYGTMAGWAARVAGPVGPGLASGVILAWAIAASTPLFYA